MHLLGKTVRDKITGFTGIVTGFVTYLTGCNQALIAERVGDDGDLKESIWLDEQRLEVLNAKRLVLENGNSPGSDKPAPKR